MLLCLLNKKEILWGTFMPVKALMGHCKMTLCYTFCPSDDLFSGLLKSSKKKQHRICYSRDPPDAG